MNLEKLSLASCVNGSGEVVISQLEDSEPGASAGGYLRLRDDSKASQVTACHCSKFACIQ